MAGINCTATCGLKLPIPVSGSRSAELGNVVGIEAAVHMQAAGISSDLGDQKLLANTYAAPKRLTWLTMSTRPAATASESSFIAFAKFSSLHMKNPNFFSLRPCLPASGLCHGEMVLKKPSGKACHFVGNPSRLGRSKARLYTSVVAPSSSHQRGIRNLPKAPAMRC